CFPDLRGMFLRGVDRDPTGPGGAGQIDPQPARVVGDVQKHQMPGHAHEIPVLTGQITNGLGYISVDEGPTVVRLIYARPATKWVGTASKTFIGNSANNNEPAGANGGIAVSGEVLTSNSWTMNAVSNVDGEVRPVN